MLEIPLPSRVFPLTFGRASGLLCLAWEIGCGHQEGKLPFCRWGRGGGGPPSFPAFHLLSNARICNSLYPSARTHDGDLGGLEICKRQA